MYELDVEQSKREFYYHESDNNMKNNIENDDSMSRVCKVCCLKRNITNLLLTSTAWSLRKNIRPRLLCTHLALRVRSVLSRPWSDIFT